MAYKSEPTSYKRRTLESTASHDDRQLVATRHRIQKANAVGHGSQWRSAPEISELLVKRASNRLLFVRTGIRVKRAAIKQPKGHCRILATAPLSDPAPDLVEIGAAPGSAPYEKSHFTSSHHQSATRPPGTAAPSPSSRTAFPGPYLLES